mmetsp:Transcript_10196/g.44370  ORF Transcript_10196/g.44370 Transcript_10196/m.44370 type:complete len:385 (+) Transcript_10196:774-1928(+)
MIAIDADQVGKIFRPHPVRVVGDQNGWLRAQHNVKVLLVLARAVAASDDASVEQLAGWIQELGHLPRVVSVAHGVYVHGAQLAGGPEERVRVRPELCEHGHMTQAVEVTQWWVRTGERPVSSPLLYARLLLPFFSILVSPVLLFLGALRRYGIFDRLYRRSRLLHFLFTSPVRLAVRGGDDPVHHVVLLLRQLGEPGAVQQRVIQVEHQDEPPGQKYPAFLLSLRLLQLGVAHLQSLVDVPHRSAPRVSPPRPAGVAVALLFLLAATDADVKHEPRVRRTDGRIVPTVPRVVRTRPLSRDSASFHPRPLRRRGVSLGFARLRSLLHRPLQQRRDRAAPCRWRLRRDHHRGCCDYRILLLLFDRHLGLELGGEVVVRGRAHPSYA